MTHYLFTAFLSPTVGWLTIAFFLMASVGTYFRRIFAALPPEARSGPAWIGLLLWIEILLKLTLFVLNWQFGLLVYGVGYTLGLIGLLERVGSIVMLPFTTAELPRDLPDPAWFDSPFVQDIALRAEHREFVFNMLLTVGAYVGLSLLVNAMPQDTAIQVAWVFQILRLTLYVYIFWLGATRTSECGYRLVWAAWALGILGRVNDFEVIVIPAVVLASLVLSKWRRAPKPIRPD